GDARPAVAAGPRAATRPGGDLPEVPEQGRGPALPRRRRPGRGPAPLAGRRADRGGDRPRRAELPGDPRLRTAPPGTDGAGSGRVRGPAGGQRPAGAPEGADARADDG